MDHENAKQPVNVTPGERPCEPDHPMILEGGVTCGDTRFMLRCMFEELLLAGIGSAELQAMSQDPNYQALYAARTALGAKATDALLAETAVRIGVHRFGMWESRSDYKQATLTVTAQKKST